MSRLNKQRILDKRIIRNYVNINNQLKQLSSMMSLIKPKFFRNNRTQDNKVIQTTNSKSVSNTSKYAFPLTKKSHSISAVTEPNQNEDYIKYLKRRRSLLPPLKQLKPRSYLAKQPIIALQQIKFIRKGIAKPMKDRIKTQEASKFIIRGNFSRNSSCKSLKSCSGVQANSRNPTDRYISRLNNIKFVQRLLLVKPTNDLRKESHQKFYTQQQHFKEIMSRNSSISNYSKIDKNKQLKYKKPKRQWI